MMGGRLLVFSLFLLVQCMSLTTTATVVVEPRPTVDVDGYAEWTQAVRATLRLRAPGLTRVPGSSEGADDAVPSESTDDGATRNIRDDRVTDVPDPPRKPCDETGCGGGACNNELGACRCPLSLSGDNCERFVPARCDEDPSWPRELVGVQYKSRCAGECDLTAAKCRCGRGTHVGGGDAGGSHTTASGAQKSAPTTSTTPQPKNGTAYAGPYAPGDTPMSKYPDRPMQQCYYEGILKDRAWHRNLAWDRWRGAPAESFWQSSPKNQTQTNWCSLDPSGDGTTHVEPAVRCTCFDGYFGDGCAERVKQFCLNDCSGAGTCEHGLCRCDEAHFGADCSQLTAGGITPTGVGSGYAIGGSGDLKKNGVAPDGGTRRRHHHTPRELADKSEKSEKSEKAPPASTASPSRTRTHARRPLVYVYDVLPQFTTSQLQHRQDVRKCVTRYAEGGNATRFEDNLYGAEAALHELFLDSPHRVDDPAIADFFFVPMYHFCFISRLQQPTPGHSQELFSQTRGAGCKSGGSHADAVFQHLFTPMLRHITHDYPWWNRSNGADHIVPFLHDEGACYAPKEFAAATLLTHWGRGDVDPESCTAFQVHSFGDRERDENFKGCAVKRADMLAGSPPGRGACYRRGVDIVIPPWRTPKQFASSPLLLAASSGADAARQTSSPSFKDALADDTHDVHDVEDHAARALLRASVDATVRYARMSARDGPFFLFRGDIRENNPKHSRGTRQEAFRFYGPGKAKASPDVIVDAGAETYRQELASATFCGVFQGDGWSARFEDAILNGCVPVVVMDDVDVAWEGYLDVQSLSIRHPRSEMHSLVETLRSIPPERVTALRVAGAKSWHRFAWLGYFAAERERERAGLVTLTDDGWHKDRETLGKIAGVHGADAFETLLQVLRHRLVERERLVQ